MEKMQEYLYYNQLYDLYGSLLTNTEQEIFKLIYEEDLSLQEIADIRGVSKSAIGKTKENINKKLIDYENKLRFYKVINSLDSKTKENIKNMLEMSD